MPLQKQKQNPFNLVMFTWKLYTTFRLKNIKCALKIVEKLIPCAWSEDCYYKTFLTYFSALVFVLSVLLLS
jgi:hypothetical protein